MINKKYLTKQIYHDDVWWDLVKVYSPNMYEDWLLLSKLNGSCFADGSEAHEFIVIEDGNDDWLPDTKKVRSLLKKRDQLRSAQQKELYTVEGKLDDIRSKIFIDGLD